jgi:putative PIN family toxin of toxin-antitoxin system
VRIVLDTNVLMSAVFFGGAPLEILRAWRKGRVKLLASAAILEEYSRVVDELGRRYPLEAARSVVALVSERAVIVEGGDVGDLRCDDPDDLKFLACAVAGKADAVVSGDKHLLRLRAVARIPILTPRSVVDGLVSRRPKTRRAD